MNWKQVKEIRQIQDMIGRAKQQNSKRRDRIYDIITKNITCPKCEKSKRIAGSIIGSSLSDPVRMGWQYQVEYFCFNCNHQWIVSEPSEGFDNEKSKKEDLIPVNDYTPVRIEVNADNSMKLICKTKVPSEFEE